MTTKGTDNRFRSLTVVGESGTPSTPGAGDFKLYVADDGTFYVMDDTGTPTALGGGGFSDPMTTRGDIIVRNASNVTDRLGRGAAGTFLGSDGTDLAWATPSAPDPIAEIFGTPDTAYEFSSSSLTGLTAVGTADAEDADTTFAGHYTVKDNDSEWCGRYAAVSTPFTGITKLSDALIGGDYQYAGIFAGVGTPGKMVVCGIRNSGGLSAFTLTYANPTDGSPGSPSTSLVPFQPGWWYPWYFGVRAASSTDISYFVSKNGRHWYPMVLNHNNSMTAASVGIVVGGYGGAIARGSFDYLRIWNSAKTFPQWS